MRDAGTIRSPPFLSLALKLLSSLFSSQVKGGLPVFAIPNIALDMDSFLICLPTCISLALVGIIESVLTLQLVDEILEDISDSTGRCTQECLAQGISNLMSAMFQSMGGDAMIGQSTINVKSGGTGRLSTGFAAIMFLIFILALSSVIELLPVAALTGAKESKTPQTRP